MTPVVQPVAELARRSIAGAMAYCVLLLVVLLFTPYASEHPWILESAILLLALTGLARVTLARKLLSHTENVPAWANTAFRLGVLASATIWSAFTVLVVSQYGEQWTAMMLLLMTAGIAAGGLSSLAPDALLARLYLSTMLLPPLAATAMNGGSHGYAIAITIAIFMLFLLADCRHQNTNYWRSIEHETALKVKATELEKARKLAQEATLAKSSFLANMSHEIRTPMNAVIGMTELLLDSELNIQHENCVRVIKESSESLLAIIDDILDLSKIEAGKLELESTNFDLRDSVHDVLRTLALRAHSKGLDLSCRFRTEVPDALVGDTGRLRQILINLVGNAIKFTSEGSISIQISREKELGDECVLHFAVIDSGIGIPEDKHHLIFDPFTQADGSTTREFGGTGLGLSISRTFVEMMNGRIWFDSQLGKGSTFHFTARLGIQKKTTAPTLAIDMSSLSDLHVLVVDDDPGSGRIVEEIVQSWRMRATVVDDCLLALRTLDDAKRDGKYFDFVLIDARMPDEEGFSVAERIVKDSERAAPIMMLNSLGHEKDVARCRELGIPAYLIKPISESDLFDAMMASRGYRADPNAEPLIMTHDSLRESRRKLRILLAEDNPVNQMVAQQMLANRGHEVIVVSNGQEALTCLEKSPPFNLILMDIQMPTMDGFHATAAIRELERHGTARTPIIAMTAHAMKGDRERCIAAGMDAYISKPVRSIELYQTIDAVLKRTPSSAPDEIRKPKTTTSPVFDRSEVLKRLGGNADLIRNVVRVFTEEYPCQVSQIRAAIEARDCQELVMGAHTLKGSLLTLSAGKALEAVQKLETSGRSGELAGCDEILLTLEAQVSKLSVELEEMVNTLA